MTPLILKSTPLVPPLTQNTIERLRKLATMKNSDYVYLPEEDKKIRIGYEDWSMLVAKSRQQSVYDEVMNLSELDRIKLSTYHERDADWFAPYGAAQYVGKEVPSHPLSWWNGLTADEQTYYQAAAILKEQILGKPIERYAPIDFYEAVDASNALDWYYGCPEHLRRKIDAEIASIDVRTVTRDADEATWDSVAFALGDRPRIQYDVFEGRKEIRSYLQLAVYKTWCATYQRELIKKKTAELAPTIQEERRLLNKAMGIDVESTDLPSQADGLDTTQAATVRWIQSQGQTPLEFLVEAYKNNDCKMSDRLNAAKALLEFVHRKLPTKQEIETEDKTAPKLSLAALKGLNAKDLALLESLLEKLSDKAGE